MHRDGWLAERDSVSINAFFPYAWGWLEGNKQGNIDYKVFPLCMGMVGYKNWHNLKKLSFSPMHGDGWRSYSP